MFDNVKLKGLRAVPSILTHFQPEKPPPDTNFSWQWQAQHVDLAVDVYQSSSMPSDKLPIVINLQGAGFTMHNLKSDAHFCRYLADSIHCVVLDFDYPKAPEHPWPQPVEGIEAFLDWIIANAAEKGWDADRIAICGFSSGGCLALVVASCQSSKLRSISAFYPSTDFSVKPGDKPSVKMDSDACGEEIPIPIRNFFYKSYLPGFDKRTDLQDPRVSPSFAPPANFPPLTSIVYCGGDRLSTEAKDLVRKLKESNKDVQEYDAEGQGHAWDKDKKAFDVSTKAGQHRQQSYEFVANRIKQGFQM